MARTKEFDEDEVLTKAICLFTSKGYNGTSAQDLVDQLGISRSSLYDTFGDKRGLFIRAINKYRNESTAEMIDFIERTGDVKKSIRYILQRALDESVDNKLNGCLLVNSTIEMAPHDAEIAAISADNMRMVEDALYHAIRKGQQDGQVSQHHSARSLARFFFNTLSGIRVTVKAGGDKKIYDDIIKVAISTLQ